MAKLTTKMKQALAIAARDGSVAAGNGAHAGRVERVHPMTILSLIKQGYLSHCYNSDGGLGGKLTDKGLGLGCFGLLGGLHER